jgi:2-polyprenyl-3-methyl-5-hydroxy-6-metoxy-1,4-benzoquinol methylase
VLAQRPCPICDHRHVDPLHEQRFVLPDGHPLAGGYAVVCCASCGAVFADTAVSQAAYDAYYAELSKYEDTTTTTGAGETPWDAQRLRDTAADIAAHLPSTARVVDLGCANGGLLRELKAIGFTDVAGLDPSPACVRITREAAGVQVEEGSLFAVPESLRGADAYLLTHVLEHIEDVDAAIASMADALAPGGVLYVETPDASRYRDFIDAPFQDFNTEHINHFSPVALRNAMARNGLVPVAEGTKVFDSAPRSPYPALFGFFRKGDAGPVERDDALRPAIETYIDRSRALLDAFDAQLRAVLADGGRVAVWGTGQLTMKLLAETALGTAPIAAFVDGNPMNHGRRLHGAEVLAPEALSSLDVPIVVGSTIHQDEIVDRIRGELGLDNELVLLSRRTFSVRYAEPAKPAAVTPARAAA